MKFFSWNVNSLRSCETEFIQFISDYSPDLVAIQELRAHEDQLSFFLKTIEGYKFLFNDSGRPGYAGTAVYYKESLPVSKITESTGNKILDMEGRTIYMKIGKVHFYNFYTPNGNSSEERLELKYEFYDQILKLANKHINNGDSLLIGGDLNVAATEKDVYQKNPRNSGYLPDERKWFQDMLDLGIIDTFRKYEQGSDFYSWWNLRDPMREENNGWRYDYFLASNNLDDQVIDAGIEKDVFGSDHCPVWVEISDSAL